MLDPKRFLRVHRNVVVNLDHVSEFHLPQDGNMFVKLNNGAALPLRKGNRSEIRRFLRNRP
jgi:DNA-binding LytR/AlgR family response regulator